MRFLVDNQLPPSLARFISQDLQAEALHVTEIGMRDSADAAVWSYAAENNFVVISKDDDFVTLYSQTPSASLLWVRIGNCRRAFLLNVFRDHWPRIIAKFERGEKFVELR